MAYRIRHNSRSWPSRHTSKDGEALIRQVEIHVFKPDGKKEIMRQTAAKRRGFNQEQVDKMLERASDTVENAFPGETFRLVDLKKGRFNIIHVPQTVEQVEEEQCL